MLPYLLEIESLNKKLDIKEQVIQHLQDEINRLEEKINNLQLELEKRD